MAGELYSSYDVVGTKEDVSDVISNISPTKTPFQSMIGSEPIHNTLFEWQEDSLRAVAVNAKVEGADAVMVARAPTVMRSNRTQILADYFQVSGTNDKTSKYGRAKESAYQASLAATALKRDLEHAFVGVDQAAVTGDESTARKMASYFQQIDADAIAYTGGSSTAIDEADILAVAQTLYDNGADPDTIMVTPADSLIVADLAKATGRVRDINNGSKDRAIVNVIDLYISPFGELKVVLNRFLLSTATLIFDAANWKKAVLRDWTRETLAKTGDSLKMMILGEFSLKHKNQKASGYITKAADA
jgi:hypothetical protein